MLAPQKERGEKRGESQFARGSLVEENSLQARVSNDQEERTKKKRRKTVDKNKTKH